VDNGLGCGCRARSGYRGLTNLAVRVTAMAPREAFDWEESGPLSDDYIEAMCDERGGQVPEIGHTAVESDHL
jgi:hypothetical protein